jgi:hypothetical protein
LNKWLPLLLLCLPGCGAELERSSEVETLRVLGVHKTKSYAQAGDEVTFSMLWHDPDGRDITPVWFAATEAELGVVGSLVEHCADPLDLTSCDCNPFADSSDPSRCEGADSDDRPWNPTEAVLPLCSNPPRDTYFECLQLHSLLADPVVRTLASKPGNSITLNVPTSTVVPPNVQTEGFGLPSLKDCDAIGDDFDCRGIYHAPPDPSLPDFGSMFVFYALCPGELGFQNVKEGFGLTCLDENDNPFGADDFVFGYSQLFLYEDFQNQNPVVEGMVVDGTEVTAACIGPACLEADDERPEECSDGVPCLDVCTESEEDDCPEVDIKPIIPERVRCPDSDADAPAECDNAELDDVAKIAYGRDYDEQMWIRYYTDQGRVASEVKLLNDATTGWNDDYGTKLRLPQEPGPLRLWAVVYDNRGAQDWVRVDAVVQE